MEQTYAERYILFHRKRQPRRQRGVLKIEVFLAHLAVERKVLPST